jgi:hypothetical protein
MKVEGGRMREEAAKCKMNVLIGGHFARAGEMPAL